MLLLLSVQNSQNRVVAAQYDVFQLHPFFPEIKPKVNEVKGQRSPTSYYCFLRVSCAVGRQVFVPAPVAQAGEERRRGRTDRAPYEEATRQNWSDVRSRRVILLLHTHHTAPP